MFASYIDATDPKKSHGRASVPATHEHDVDLAARERGHRDEATAANGEYCAGPHV
jgi:hypothetical protein